MKANLWFLLILFLLVSWMIIFEILWHTEKTTTNFQSELEEAKDRQDAEKLRTQFEEEREFMRNQIKEKEEDIKETRILLLNASEMLRKAQKELGTLQKETELLRKEEEATSVKVLEEKLAKSRQLLQERQATQERRLREISFQETIQRNRKCGIGSLFNLTGLYFSLDLDKSLEEEAEERQQEGESGEEGAEEEEGGGRRKGFQTHTENKLFLRVYVSDEFKEQKEHNLKLVSFYSVLIGPEIIPLSFSLLPSSNPLDEKEKKDFLVASFVPQLPGNYSVDLSVMQLEREERVGDGNETIIWFSGWGAPWKHKVECNQLSRLVGTPSQILVAGVGSIIPTRTCSSFEEALEGRWWSMNGPGDLIGRNRGDDSYESLSLTLTNSIYPSLTPHSLALSHSCLSRLPSIYHLPLVSSKSHRGLNPFYNITDLEWVLNDDNGMNYNWYWQPHSCSLNYNLKEVVPCVEQKSTTFWFEGDSQMMFLNLTFAFLFQKQPKESENDFPSPTRTGNYYYDVPLNLIQSHLEEEMLHQNKTTAIPTPTTTTFFVNFALTHILLKSDDEESKERLRGLVSLLKKDTPLLNPNNRYLLFPLFPFAGYREPNITLKRTQQFNSFLREHWGNDNTGLYFPFSLCCQCSCLIPPFLFLLQEVEESGTFFPKLVIYSREGGKLLEMECTS
jgi:hypothetical protein